MNLPHQYQDTKELSATLKKIAHLSSELTEQYNHNNIPTLRTKAHILMNEVSILLWSIEALTGPQGYSPYHFQQPNIQQNIIHTSPNNRYVQIQNVQQTNGQNSSIQQTMNTSTKRKAPTSPTTGSSGSEVDSSPQYNSTDSTTPPSVSTDPFIETVISRKRRTRNGKTATNKKPKICDICKTTKTPLWRTGPQYTTLCNACGLSYRKMDQMEEAKKESVRKVAIDNLIN